MQIALGVKIAAARRMQWLYLLELDDSELVQTMVSARQVALGARGERVHHVLILKIVQQRFFLLRPQYFSACRLGRRE
jgi:hypothetical protein